MGRELIIKSTIESKQRDDDILIYEKIIEPFLNYDKIKALYSANIYHQRSLKLKALLLSQIKESNLDNYLKDKTASKFLYNFVLNAETFGTAFVEKAGSSNDFALYNLSSYKGRIGIDNRIYQDAINEYIALDGAAFLYPTILSEYYGEPDYISAINQIYTLYKADIYNSKFFDNGAKPDQVIIFEDSDPSEEQIEAIKKFYKKEFGGYKNAHKTLILTTGEGNGETKPKIRVEDISKIRDLSFEKLKKVGRDEIIAAHAIPPRLVGVVEPSQLGGGGELIGQLHMFNELTIKPKIALIEEFFNSTIGVKLKLKPFNPDNFKDDADLLTKLVNATILTPQEAKSLLGW